MALELENILITGATGFIGGYLREYFDAQGVIYTVFRGDLLNRGDIDTFFLEHPGITQIVHLAGIFEGDIDIQMARNFATTKNLLEIAEKHDIKKIVYTSTGAVYGEPVRDMSYEDDMCQPNTWYGLSKQYAEEIISYYARNKGFTTVILRFPNVYGSGSRGVISAFLRSIRDSGRITIYGDGEQSRNFLHVSDAVRSIALATEYPSTDIFNITNPVKTSLNALVAILKQSFSFDVEYLPTGTNTLRDLLLSPEKAEKLLGFVPEQRNIRID